MTFSQVSIAYRLPREAVAIAVNEDFTEAQLNTLQAELEKKLPKEMADQLTNSLSKFTTDSVHTYTPDEKYKAFVSFIGFIPLFPNDIDWNFPRSWN